MKKDNFLKFYDTYKKGSFTKVIKLKDNKNGYFKKSVFLARFVNYYNIKEVKEKNQDATSIKKRDYELQIIPHILKLNLNTNNLLLCIYPVKNHKTQSIYYFNDMEITADQYYKNSGDKIPDNKPSLIYTLKLDEVLTIGC